jgi:exopolysaccharide biosynthesis polyprenyl glycosylphosphotransferase
MAVSAGERSVAQGAADGLDTRSSAILGEIPGPEPAARRARRRRVRRTLIASDLVAFTFAALIAEQVASPRVQAIPSLVVFAILLPLWMIGMSSYGLYNGDEQRPDYTTLDDAGPAFTFITIGTWLGLVVLSFVGSNTITIEDATVFWLTSLILVLGGRAISRTYLRWHRAYLQNTIIVGAGDVGQLVGRKMLQHPELGIRLVGFVDSEPKQMRSDLSTIPLLGTPEEIVGLVRRHDVERVVVAFSNDRHDLLVDLVRKLTDLDVQIDLVPRLFEAVGPSVGMHAVEGLPLVSLRPTRDSRGARTIKRGLDLIGATLLLILVAPLFAAAAWRIKRDSPGPVLFAQERLGKNMEPFTVYKFRTMRVDTDPEPHREYLQSIMTSGAVPLAESGNLYKLERPDAVTSVGAWLRRTSLDELPQLINVIRGEMSLVGPRPCIPYETELFEPHHFDRFLVPAGMTGLWQVSARAHATFKEALDLDAAYARSWSLRLDLRLLLRTPYVMVRSRETA